MLVVRASYKYWRPFGAGVGSGDRLPGARPRNRRAQRGRTRPARDRLLLPGAGGRPVRHRRGTGRLPVRDEPPRGLRDARAPSGLRVPGLVDVGGGALPASAVARGRAEAGILVPRALPDKDGGGRRRGKEIAVVEIVPYVRFGSIIFGETSYELDASEALPAGILGGFGSLCEKELD